MVLAATDPADSEAIGLGASRIRDTRTYLLREVVDVKDYGAKGDGVMTGSGITATYSGTDDSVAIQAALVAGAGKTVLFPPGIYMAENLTISAGTILRGTGGKYRGGVLIVSMTDNSSVLKLIYPNSSVTIRDLELATDVTDPTTITGRRGILFTGNVTTGSLSNYTFDNLVIRNFNRGLSFESDDGSGWMVDTVKLDHVYFVENMVPIYCNARNVTNVTVDTSPLGTWPHANSCGVDLVSFGTFTFLNTWAGGANNPLGLGVGFKIGVGSNVTWLNCGTEGPNDGIIYDAGNIGMGDRPMVLINGSWGAIKIKSSNKFVSMGNWFNGDVTFSDFATDARWFSLGDAFNSTFDFKPYSNSFVHYASGKRRWLNAQNDSTPKSIVNTVLHPAAANLLVHIGGPPGIYRLSIYVQNGSGANTLSCLAYWFDRNTGTQKSQELLPSSPYAAGQYSASIAVDHRGGITDSLIVRASSSVDTTAYLGATIELVAPDPAFAAYW